MSHALSLLIDPVFAGFLSASMRLAIPILLAALGGLFAERSGVLNIGLEGAMLAGAFAGFLAAYASGSIVASGGSAISPGKSSSAAATPATHGNTAARRSARSASSRPTGCS